MKHTPHTPLSAAQAARSILARTSRIAGTWAEELARRRHLAALKPGDRPGDGTWANAYQAFRLASEQLVGPGREVPEPQHQELVEAIKLVLPELFAEHWDNL